MGLPAYIIKFIDLFYLPVFRRMMSVQTFRYAACGAANMALNIVLYYLIFHYVVCESNLDLRLFVLSPHIATLFIVFPITFFNGFLLNKYVAFRQSPLRNRVQFLRYMISVGGNLVLNYVLMKLFVDVCGFYPTPSMMLNTVINVAYSYMMQKHFSFRGYLKD